MISKYSVRKPYTVLVAVALVIVLGAVAIMRMTTDLLPDMSFQYALIITTDVGASPETVETDVTAPIEASMATTSNIKNITSTSYNSYSMVICEYEQSANMDSVVIEIQQKLDQLTGGFPDSVGSPMIMQINPDMLPIMIAAVDVDGMSQNEIADYVNNELIPAIESVEGVASASASGAIEENIKITLDQEKIDALNEKLATSINEKMDDAEKEIKSGKSKLESAKKDIANGRDELAKKTSEAGNEVDKNRIGLINTKNELTSQLKDLEALLDVVANSKKYYDKGVALSNKLGSSNNRLEEIQAEIAIIQSFADVDWTNPAAFMSLTPEQIAYLANYSEYMVSPEKMAELPGAIANRAIELGNEASELTKNPDVMKTYAEIEALNMKLRPTSEKVHEYFGFSIDTYEDLAHFDEPMNAAKKATVVSGLEDGIKKIKDGIVQIDDGLAAIDKGAVELEAGKLEALNQMSNGYADIVTATTQLEEGQAKLDEARDSALAQADLTKKLTVDTISQLLVAQNFDMPAGYAYDNDGTEFLVHVGKAVDNIDDLKDLVLMDFNTDEVGIVRVSDIATVEMMDNSDETYAIINGNPGVMLTMEKQSGYSTGDVTDRLLDKFDALQKEDNKLHLSVLMNQGIYIDMVVKSVFQNMIIGAILAIFVLLLFLKDIKPTIIIAVSIPFSVITAVVLMYFSDISLNIISMSGLVLGIGMLVDNSIVVIENIYRLRNEGYTLKKAAVEGAGQVTGAIFASTLTTVSVYAPIIFTDGITRQLFVDLALTIAYTLAASLIVALTVVPAMSSFMLKNTKEIKHNWFDKFTNVYGKFLELCLNHKIIVFVVSIALLLSSAALCLSNGLDFMNMEMEADQLSATIKAKEDEHLEFDELKDYSNTVMDRISDIEGIDTVGAMIGGGSLIGNMSGGNSDSVSMYILLDPERESTLEDIAAEITARTDDLDCQIDIETNMMDMSAMMASGISIQIKGRNIDTIQDLTAKVADIVRSTEGVAKVDDGLKIQADEFMITVNKQDAAEYGYTVAQVFQLVYKEMASSTSATTLLTDVKDYDVYVQSEVQSDAKLSDIEKLTFTHTNEDGEEEEIPISKIAKLDKKKTLSTIRRDGQTRYLTVSATIDDDHNITLVANQIQEKLNKLDIPEGYEVAMKGEDETINESMSQMVLMLLLAVIFIYLIMVAQFQSLLNPFIIMFSIPLAFTGGFVAVYLSGEPLSVISMLGFIMLAGLIVNNGIVLIDYITQARREGVSKRDAIIDSGKIRIRPILMTALTTILAMSTTALGMGEGSEMMAPMAVSIIGGLIYGTLLTLIVIPCLYDVFNREKNMVEEEL